MLRIVSRCLSQSTASHSGRRHVAMYCAPWSGRVTSEDELRGEATPSQPPEHVHQTQQHLVMKKTLSRPLRSLRRRSMVDMLTHSSSHEAVDAYHNNANENRMDVTTTSAATSSTSLAASSSTFLQPSEYSTVFAKHTAAASRNEGIHLHNSNRHRSRDAAGRGAHSSKSDEGEELSALQALKRHQTSTRTLFASSTPTMRLRKSAALIREERRRAKQAALNNQTESNDDDATSSSVVGVVKQKPISTTVDVPLLPPQFLRQRAFMQQQHQRNRSKRWNERDDEDTDAERLHLAAARNTLAQSDEIQLFRCLRCFHVFRARPSIILAPQLAQSWTEVHNEEDNRREALRIAKRPGIRKNVASVGKRRAAAQDDPHACVQCGSNKVQWAMEYVHHKTHHRTTEKES